VLRFAQHDKVEVMGLCGTSQQICAVSELCGSQEELAARAKAGPSLRSG